MNKPESYAVDSDAISGHGSTVGELAKDIKDKIDLMNRKLSTLQTTWTGSASTQFASLYGDWEKKQRSLKDSLEAISRALGQTANDYSTTETTIRKRFIPA